LTFWTFTDIICFNGSLKVVIIVKPDMQGFNEKKATDVLSEVLSRVPFLSVQEIERNAVVPALEKYPTKLAEIDILARLRSSSSEEQLLIVEVKNNGQPSYVNRAIDQLSRYKVNFPDAYFVFMAPYISPRSAEICKRQGIGYIDFSGNCNLSFKNVFIERNNYPSLFQEKRELRSLFFPKATRVLRVLLEDPGRLWKVNELANKAKVSLGLASNIKKRLLEQAFIEELTEGVKLKEPEQLLKKWSENYSYEDNEISSYYSMKSMADVESEIAEVCKNEGIQYALTGFSGAARLAPSVRYQQAMIFVDVDNTEKITNRLNLKPGERGANISLWKPYDVYVFYSAKEIDNIKIVSPEQIYLDLNKYPGRGKEAAEAILDEVLRHKW
jgi:hypothetical protein